MYGIFTTSGAMLTKFRAFSFEQAMAIMERLIQRKPQLSGKSLFLSKVI